MKIIVVEILINNKGSKNVKKCQQQISQRSEPFLKSASSTDVPSNSKLSGATFSCNSRLMFSTVQKFAIASQSAILRLPLKKMFSRCICPETSYTEKICVVVFVQKHPTPKKYVSLYLSRNILHRKNMCRCICPETSYTEKICVVVFVQKHPTPKKYVSLYLSRNILHRKNMCRCICPETSYTEKICVVVFAQKHPTPKKYLSLYLSRNILHRKNMCRCICPETSYTEKICVVVFVQKHPTPKNMCR